MIVIPQHIPEVLLIKPKVISDNRGSFMEAFHETRYHDAGLTDRFIQDNVSISVLGTIRGLHLQHPNDQGKLVSVLDGEVFDVAVDVRVNSPTFGKWVGVTLSSTNNFQLYIPPGFAHGFCVTSDKAIFSYKCTAFHDKESEIGILYNDPDIGIAWPKMVSNVISEKDKTSSRLSQIEMNKLPKYNTICE